MARYDSQVENRFRSRAFILLLIEEARTLVRSKPEQAASLAALVPIALDQVPGRENAVWAQELLIRGEAHHANALRVAGDLPGAERRFDALRRKLKTGALTSISLRAEITSLDASLRVDQRRIAEAELLLDDAASAFRRAGDVVGLARTRIKQAGVIWTEGRPADVLRILSEAADHLAAASQPVDQYLQLCTITWRVLALCELERFPAANDLLQDRRRDYETSGDPYSMAVLRGLEGRIALGMGDLVGAKTAYVACRDGYLALGRYHDAALACLDIADTLLAERNSGELRELAASLLPLFQSRGAERETLASLRLLAEAVQAESLTTALLAELRRKLDTGLPSAGGASEHR